MFCKYCKCEVPDEGTSQESCPLKPFTVILTRAEIWGITDGFPTYTKEAVIKRLREIIKIGE